MRLWKLLLVPIILASGAIAQTGEQAGPPEVLIVKHEWSKERIAWETDPLSAPNETYAAMKNRVRNERRPRTALEERSIRDATEDQKKPLKPPRYVFRYLLTVHNT